MNAESSAAYRRWMPTVIALCPVIYLYATNFSSVSSRDLIPPLAFVVFISLVTHAMLRRLISDPDEAVLAASWLIAGLFAFGIVYNVLNTLFQATIVTRILLPHKYGLVGWFLIWITAFVVIMRFPWPLAKFNRFLFTLSLTFLAISGMLVAQKWIAERSLARIELPSWSTQDFDLKLPENPTDIYFLVFDRYGGLKTLLKEYQYDNSAFYDELRERGFNVNEESRSNYPRTMLSMASALNCEYLPEQVQQDQFYMRLIDDHRVGRSLVHLGYNYVHLGNNYGPLRTNKNATSDMPPSFLPSEFADILYYMTPLSRIIAPQDKYEFVKEKFRRVRDADGQGRPMFVYGHFLVPHRPYVFASDGSRLPEWEVAKLESKKNYIGQLQATNRMILETIDAILKKPGTDPIIVLTADEGPYLKQVDEDLPRVERILYRARIISAVRLPKEDDASKISEAISPVNLFRFIFDRYFGSSLGLLPDRTFFWEKEGAEGQPAKDNARFIDVTEAIQE